MLYIAKFPPPGGGHLKDFDKGNTQIILNFLYHALFRSYGNLKQHRYAIHSMGE